jgi:hypothetical protein
MGIVLINSHLLRQNGCELQENPPSEKHFYLKKSVKSLRISKKQHYFVFCKKFYKINGKEKGKKSGGSYERYQVKII